jgi:phospholipid-binding lipoprotein MlaA
MHTMRATIVIAMLAVSFGPQAEAASNNATYDVDYFLNQSHPFDTAAQPAPLSPTVISPAPVVPSASGAADDLDDMDMDDLDMADADLSGDNGDPLETMNRAIFGFNQIVETVLFKPIAYTYNALVPDVGRDAVRDFLSNLSSPVVLANDLLQGEFGRAFDTGQRTLINTTIGIGGLWDAAEWMGIPEHDEDFGQTLAVWGVGEGVYLVVPFLGPSNPRDLIGQYGVDGFMDPVAIYLDNEGQDDWQLVRMGANGLVKYADLVDQLDELEATSIDYYAAIRNLYRQRRKAQINNIDVGSVAAFSYDDPMVAEEIPD